MLELLQSGGWLMLPLALAGVVAPAAYIERPGTDPCRVAPGTP